MLRADCEVGVDFHLFRGKEARRAVQLFDACLLEILFGALGDGVCKSGLGLHQRRPVDLRDRLNTDPGHLLREVGNFGCSDQVFFWLAAAHGAGSAIGTVIHHRYPPSSLAQGERESISCGARPDHQHIIDMYHGKPPFYA